MAHLSVPEPHQPSHDLFTLSPAISTTETLVDPIPEAFDSQVTLAIKPSCMLDAERSRSVRGSVYISETGSRRASKAFDKPRSSCKERVFLASFCFLDFSLGVWTIYTGVRYILALGKAPDYVVQRRCAVAFAVLSIFSALIFVISLIFVYLRRRPSYLWHQLMLLLASIFLIAPCITGIAIVSDAVEGQDPLSLLGRCKQDEDVLWSSEGAQKCIPGVGLGSWMVGAVFRFVVTLIFLVALHSTLHGLRGYWDFEERPTSTVMSQGKPGIKPLLLFSAGPKTENGTRHSIGFAVGQVASSSLYPAGPPPLPPRDHRRSSTTGADASSSAQPRSTIYAPFAPISVGSRAEPSNVARQQSLSRSDKEGSDPDTEISEAQLEVAVVRPASRYDRPRYYEITGPTPRQSVLYTVAPVSAVPNPVRVEPRPEIPPPPPPKVTREPKRPDTPPVAPLPRSRSLNSQGRQPPIVPSSMALPHQYPSSSLPSSTSRRHIPAPPPVHYHRYNAHEALLQGAIPPTRQQQTQQRTYPAGPTLPIGRGGSLGSRAPSDQGVGVSRTGSVGATRSNAPSGPSLGPVRYPGPAASGYAPGQRYHRQTPLGPRSRTQS